MRFFDISNFLPSLKRNELAAYDAAFLFLLFGILGLALINFNLHWVAFSLAIVLVGLLFIFQKRIIKETIAISFVSLIILSGYGLAYQARHQTHFSIGEKVTETGVISDFIHDSLSYSSIEVKADKGDFNLLTEEGEYHIGDRVRIEGIVSYVRGERIYLNKQKVALISRSGNKLILIAEAVRGGLFANINKSLTADEAALANGLLLGDTSGFSKEFKDSLRKTGTSHIVALSGWNVMILMTVAIAAAGLILRRYAVLTVSFTLILILWFLAGYSASLLRAVIMGTVFILAAFFGKRYSLRNAVVFSAFIMGIWNPAVFGDLGFQLSFAAILGLAIFSKSISRLVGKIPTGKILNRMGFSETVSAQITVMPIILANGIRFSPIGIIANLAIVSFIPITFLFVLLVSVLGDGFGILSWSVSFIANCLLGYEIEIISYFYHIF